MPDELVREHLGDDELLGPVVATRPGLRAPGHPDGTELLVRAVLGQQVSVAGARTLARRIVDVHGESLAEPIGDVTRVFPSAAALAGLCPDAFAMPRARGAALVNPSAHVADGRIVLDAGSDREATVAALQALPGIGPWTAGYVAMRALGDPDVFLPTDLGVRHALAALGADSSAKAAAALADARSAGRADPGVGPRSRREQRRVARLRAHRGGHRARAQRLGGQRRSGRHRRGRGPQRAHPR